MDFFFANIFSNKQFGFIKGRSTVLTVAQLLHWTVQLDSGKQIDVIYIDFEKAFDKVPHLRLPAISKLQSYGLSSDLIKWIQNFLCNRIQRVGVNDSVCYRIITLVPWFDPWYSFYMK